MIIDEVIKSAIAQWWRRPAITPTHIWWAVLATWTFTNLSVRYAAQLYHDMIWYVVMEVCMMYQCHAMVYSIKVNIFYSCSIWHDQYQWYPHDERRRRRSVDRWPQLLGGVRRCTLTTIITFFGISKYCNSPQGKQSKACCRICPCTIQKWSVWIVRTNVLLVIFCPILMSIDQPPASNCGPICGDQKTRWQRTPYRVDLN